MDTRARLALPQVKLVTLVAIDTGTPELAGFVRRELPEYVNSSHVLVRQWDGAATKPMRCGTSRRSSCGAALEPDA